MAKPKTFDNRDVSYNKGKAFNLSKSQLKKAGAAKAAKARTVDISGTKRATTGANKGKTLGPGGKPLTGSVKLPSGVTAVYKDGKRVTTARGKSAGRPEKPLFAGGGQRPGQKPAGRSASSTPPRSGTASRPAVKATVVKRGDGSKAKITTTKPGKKSGDVGALAPRPGEYQAGRGQVAASVRKAAADRAARASGQVPSAGRTYPNGANAAGPKSAASRGEALGLSPATGGTRANPSPYVNSSTQNQRNKPKPAGAPGSSLYNSQVPKTAKGRDTGNRSVVKYANGTASVWDPATKSRVTVSKKDPRYPK
jgi:hypothetical protein